ncbi:MAG TPA: LLM class F420-dependent oxidoreductase [Acidimicrobiales bacterium]|nr:LLM class F420-dependent oxidoreductase [Acidimicrobiales bacterium]
MRYGLTIFLTDQTIDAVTLARSGEERGFNSLWLPEHTHIPTSRRTPAPTGEPLAEEYRRSLDPFVALSAAAAVTTRLTVGTGIALVAQREPIVTAKAAATLDWQSGGRLWLGVGYGWNVDEMEDHGVVPSTRRARAREHILAMRSLWEDEVASFAGEFVNFPETWSWPKPRQRPLPILVGGAASTALFSHVAEFAQGWIPIGGAGLTDSISRLRDAVAATGRDPSDLEIIAFGSLPDHGKLDHFQEIGVTECVFRLPTDAEPEVMKRLDRYSELIDERQAGG